VPTQTAADSLRRTAWHLALLVAVSAGYESLFLHHGLNLFDEGWPAYAAMRLRAGGVLYRDVFFPFPPGHLLAAQIAFALDPPGIVLSRVLYAAFNTLACVGIYFLGRRLMPSSFALLGALLLAIAAPRSHWHHLLFGYRYFVFSIGTLLFFARRLRTGDARWMLPAGLCAGVALIFRITPAFAAIGALGIALLAAGGGWNRRLRDGGWFALGFFLGVTPALVWLAAGAGLGAVWREVVVHVVALQELQSKPAPGLALPDWDDRRAIRLWFVGVQYRLYAGLYLGYAALLAARWIRRARPDPLLIAVVAWGGLYLLRALGRSDEPHLDSALPPVCLLLAHLLSRGFGALWPEEARPDRARRLTEAGVGIIVLGGWMFLLGTDVALRPERMGTFRLGSLTEAVFVEEENKARNTDRTILAIRKWTRPGDLILDLSSSPYLYVLTGRLGPGYWDIIMPGTFLDEDDERAFVERLEHSPPAAVIWPRRHFDRTAERGVGQTAPRVRNWVMEHYRSAQSGARFSVLLPRGSPHLPDGP
jgi:hypothetical protein